MGRAGKGANEKMQNAKRNEDKENSKSLVYYVVAAVQNGRVVVISVTIRFETFAQMQLAWRKCKNVKIVL